MQKQCGICLLTGAVIVCGYAARLAPSLVSELLERYENMVNMGWKCLTWFMFGFVYTHMLTCWQIRGEVRVTVLVLAIACRACWAFDRNWLERRVVRMECRLVWRCFAKGTVSCSCREARKGGSRYVRMRESGMIKRRINREIANLKIMEGVVRAGLPEWSKGGDLRSPMRRHAWVQTPQPAGITENFLLDVFLWLGKETWSCFFFFFGRERSQLVFISYSWIILKELSRTCIPDPDLFANQLI